MKKSLLFCIIATIFSSMTQTFGMPDSSLYDKSNDSGTMYVGVGGGYSCTHWDRFLKQAFIVSSNGGTAGRTFIGYNFSKHFAAELGYIYCDSDTTVRILKPGTIYIAYDYMRSKANYIDLDGSPANAFINMENRGSVVWGHLKDTQAFDLVGKMQTSIIAFPKLNIFAKYGIHQTMSRWHDNKIMYHQYPDGMTKCFNIVYGLGFDYHIAPNVNTSVEWIRYHGNFGLSEIDKTHNSRGGQLQPHMDAFVTSIRYAINL